MGLSIKCGGTKGFIIETDKGEVFVKWNVIQASSKTDGVQVDAPKDIKISVLKNKRSSKKMIFTEDQFNKITKG